MFLLPFLLNKAVLISLSLIVVGSGTVFGGIKAGEYRDTQIILQEAKQLSSNGKYQEAVTKLVEADGKWTTSGIKKEVEGLKEENKTLLQSSSKYKLGKELFDKEKYADALEVLKKVDIRHANYFDSKSLIELAEKKIETSKGEVAGVKTEVKTVKVVKVAPEVLPTPTPTPIIPTPTPEPQPEQHTDSWCKNEAKLAVIKLEDGLNKITHEQSPWLFSYEAYLKQFYPNDIGYDAWQQFAKTTYAGMEQYAVREAEKLYLQVYQQCLGH